MFVIANGTISLHNPVSLRRQILQMGGIAKYFGFQKITWVRIWELPLKEAALFYIETYPGDSSRWVKCLVDAVIFPATRGELPAK
jgi:hypothetical protein